MFALAARALLLASSAFSNISISEEVAGHLFKVRTYTTSDRFSAVLITFAKAALNYCEGFTVPLAPPAAASSLASSKNSLPLSSSYTLSVNFASKMPVNSAFFTSGLLYLYLI